jgi:hypothetical protein
MGFIFHMSVPNSKQEQTLEPKGTSGFGLDSWIFMDFVGSGQLYPNPVIFWVPMSE